ncbi:IS110 family transposase, partial [Rhizobium sp. C4]|nr:IS110 family transposase [Rhizobium sp. C4]MCD2176194.1 IS110 family transposase [Rhizobium sp. C4]
KAPKVAITAIMRKLVVLANALLKSNRKWTQKTA